MRTAASMSLLHVPMTQGGTAWARREPGGGGSERLHQHGLECLWQTAHFFENDGSPGHQLEEPRAGATGELGNPRAERQRVSL